MIMLTGTLINLSDNIWASFSGELHSQGVLIFLDEKKDEEDDSDVKL